MILDFRPQRILDFDLYYEMDYVAGMGGDPGPCFKEVIRREQRLFNEKAHSCWMVAHDMARSPHTEVGFVAGCYITDWAVEELIAAEKPYPFPKFLEWHQSGCNPFVAGQEIGAANAGDGLNLILTTFGWDRSLAPEQVAYVRSHLLRNYAEYYSGLHYKRVIVEAYSEMSYYDCISSGFRIRNDYPKWNVAAGNPLFKPLLFVLEKDEAINGADYFMMALFSYQTPRVLFTEVQRELLLMARTGYSDKAIAQALSLSEDAVKARWKSIYAKVGAALPELLPEGNSDGRGPEKRGVLLNYLKFHPSEFWPYKVCPIT